MNNQEILERAINRAITKGWEYKIWLEASRRKHMSEDPHWETLAFTPELLPALIFNHDFAKALWGEASYGHFQQPDILRAWEFHLQQMVIAEDPIKYLGEHL